MTDLDAIANFTTCAHANVEALRLRHQGALEINANDAAHRRVAELCLELYVTFDGSTGDVASAFRGMGFETDLTWLLEHYEIPSARDADFTVLVFMERCVALAAEMSQIARRWKTVA